MTTIASREQAFCTAGHVVNSRRANLKSSSVNDVLFEAKKEELKVDKKVSHFCITVSCMSFCWLWNEPLNNFPQAVKHVAWDFSGLQTHASLKSAG